MNYCSERLNTEALLTATESNNLAFEGKGSSVLPEYEVHSPRHTPDHRTTEV